MVNARSVSTAGRILDYCQTRDAFLRAVEVTPEMLQMWADELEKTRLPESDLRDAAANAYRKAGGKPPADPLGAILAEARLIIRDRTTLQPHRALPAPERTDGPVAGAYRAAINAPCLPRPKSGGGIHHGCGAKPGEYCRGDDGILRRPHWARVLNAQDANE
jgi:hypothetical protein